MERVDLAMPLSASTASQMASGHAQSKARSPALHQYACIKCRQRKIKCDKILIGCANCHDIGTQCVYSARRPRKDRKTGLAVQRVILPAEKGSDHTDDHETTRVEFDSHQGFPSSDEEEEDDALIPREMRNAAFQARFAEQQSDQGRLFVAHGKSRYINPEKVEQLASLETVIVSNTEDTGCLKRSSPPPSHQDERIDCNSLMSATTRKRSLRKNHPSLPLMKQLWEYYVDNVDILVKIVYKPAVEQLLMTTCSEPKDADASTEALLFGICFATVMSMSVEDCRRVHGEDRRVLLRRYGHALQEALAQAGWMTTQDMVVLQALILFITFAPGRNARSTWILVGIALGIAQSMGMHSDSASFSLDAVETEVRRRVWGSLCQLDNRISEECGLEPHVPLAADTRLPLNINDSDLGKDGISHSTWGNHFTEMSVSLLKIEFADISLRVKRAKCANTPLNSEEIETMAKDKIDRFENAYFKSFDGPSHLKYLCRLGTRLIIAKLWKIKYDASTQDGELEREDSKEALLLYNAEILELCYQLPERYHPFGWFFRCKYTLWHAMAYLLKQLCDPHQSGPAVDRAWSVLDTVFKDSENPFSGFAQARSKCSLWPPLLRLLKRARQVREQSLHTTQTSGDILSTLDSGNVTANATPEECSEAMPYQDALLGDPFLGSSFDLDQAMTKEELDAWVRGFEIDLSPQECMGFEANMINESFSWW